MRDLRRGLGGQKGSFYWAVNHIVTREEGGQNGVIGDQIGVLHQYKRHLQDAFCNQSLKQLLLSLKHVETRRFERQFEQLSSLCVPNMQDIKTTFVKI